MELQLKITLSIKGKNWSKNHCNNYVKKLKEVILHLVQFLPHSGIMKLENAILNLDLSSYFRCPWDNIFGMEWVIDIFMKINILQVIKGWC